VVVFSLMCVLLSLLLYFEVLTHSFVYGCKRLQSVEIPYEGIIIGIRKIVALKLIIGSLERVECNPYPLGHNNVE
jgi:hypothetical protein